MILIIGYISAFLLFVFVLGQVLQYSENLLNIEFQEITQGLLNYTELFH